ncbi:MAG: hypothetical protein ACHBN1_19265 [Heteroscytonema crispum UTEX LB 1556]
MVNGEGALASAVGKIPPGERSRPKVGEPLRSWGLAKGRSGVFPTQATGERKEGLMVNG